MSPETLGWYASIFGWLFFTGIGIPPCPEEAGILYAAGLSALHSDVHWWLAWPIAGVAIVSADTVLYWIGRWWGVRLFEFRWVQHIIKPERRKRIEAQFHTHGIKILLLARLLPPVRTGVFLIAGSIRYSFVRFLIADAGYCVFGVGFFFFGGTWLIGLIHDAGHWFVYVAAVLLTAYCGYRYFRYLRNRERGEKSPAFLLFFRRRSAPSVPSSKQPTGG